MKSPIGPCVRVNWGPATEFVPIGPKRAIRSRFETTEYWSEYDKWVRYHPRIEENVGRNGERQYELIYDAKEHPELAGLEICWGVSTIVISNDSRSVRAFWSDANISSNSGSAPASLTKQGERMRSKARPVIRNQSVLRKLLLDTDGKCALSGETTVSVLECAHILDVKSGGFEMDDNVILLRADLHCLYDNRDFEISPQGAVINVSKALSPYYRDFLKGKKLAKEVTSRIGESLAKR